MAGHLTYGVIPMPVRTNRIALLVGFSLLIVPLATSRGGDEPKKSPRAATEVEIAFANGSVVRMVLSDAAIEVQTDYGKLSIPARDLKRIEFGVHLPDGLDKQLEQMIGELSSENFRVREAASASLLRHGAMAVPHLAEAAKNTDLELSKRAKAVLVKLHQNLPAKDFRPQTNDTIVTPKFTFVGRILTSTLKAETEYFGPVTLDLVKLRTLRSTETPSELVLALDAGQYGGQAQQWLKTDFDVDGRMKLSVTAGGQIDLWPEQGGGGQYLCTPKGFGNAPQFGRAGMRERFLPGAVVGKIGEGGTPFLIGEAYEGTPTGEGKLFLHIMPSPWNNEASGSYQIKISAK
jgi:hypothetical protein